MLTGGAGDDLVAGGPGDDAYLNGDDGDDKVFGGLGNEFGNKYFFRPWVYGDRSTFRDTAAFWSQ